MATGSLRRQHIKVNSFRYASAVLRWIIEPPGSMDEKQRRRVRLLSAFLLLIAINTLIGAIAVKNAGNSSWPIMLVTAAVLAAGYVLSRTGYHRLATVLAVTVPAFPIFTMALFSLNQANVPAQLPWLALPLLVSSLLLSLRRTMIVAISYIAIIVVLIPFIDAPTSNLSQSLAFMFMIFFFVVAVTAVRQHDQSEVERQLTERKQAEEALRESEEKYRNVVENSKDSIVIVDPKGNIQFANEASVQLTGYSLDEGIGMNLRDMILLKYWPRSLMKLREALKGKQVPYFETAIKRKDSTIVPVESGGQAILKEGKVVGVQIIARDITERKQAEEALANEAIRRRILIEQSLDGIVILDENSKVYEANQRFAEMLGYSPEEVRELHTWDWDTQWTREELLEMGRNVDEAGLHLETYHQRKDGTTIDVEISINGAVCAGQKLIFCVCRDITERKRAEKLQHDENYVLTLLGQGAELSELLDAIVSLGESYDPAIKGSVMLYDSSKELLFQAAAPSLPDSYLKLLENGLPIGPNIGSCGTAAYLKERIIVPDIENSPLFKPFEEAVEQTINNGLLASWSQPIITSSGELLGTIANYSSKVGEPDTRNLMVLEWSARIAAIAIENKRAEDALKESEEKFSKAFLASPDSIAIVRIKDSKFIEVNDSFVRFNGYTREEVIGRTATELNIWADTEERNRILKIMEEQGRVRNEEFHYRKKSGEIGIGLFSAELINIGGEPCSIALTADITERKKMEDALKESEEKLSKAFNATPETIAITTFKDGRFLEVNDSFRRLTGYTHDEVIGRTSTDLNIWANTEDRVRMLQLLNKNGKVDTEEWEFRMKSGEIRNWLFSAERINIGGEPCLISMTIDITERKQAEENLKKALSDLEQSSARLAATNKELETFSYSVSHDLRSPLRSIDGFSQALLEDHGDKLDENGQDYLERLRGASQKMGELIDGLLKLSRLTRSEIHEEPVDLSALAEDIAARLQETPLEIHRQESARQNRVRRYPEQRQEDLLCERQWRRLRYDLCR